MHPDIPEDILTHPELTSPLTPSNCRDDPKPFCAVTLSGQQVRLASDAQNGGLTQRHQDNIRHRVWEDGKSILRTADTRKMRMAATEHQLSIMLYGQST